MKNYEDIAERVFKKGDAILEKKHRRTAIIKRTSFVVSGLCAVVITGFGIWNNYSLKNAINNKSPDIIDSRNISENDMPVTTQTTALSGTAGNTDEFFPVSTSINSENLQEIIQTSVSTTATTNSATTSTDSENLPKTTQTSVTTTATTNSATTSTDSENLPKTTQTSVSTTTTTNSATTSTDSENLPKTTQTSVTTTTKTNSATTSTDSENLPQTTQTSVSTTTKTNSATTSTDSENLPQTTQTSVSTTTKTHIVTEITNPSTNIDDERSLKMKKLISIMSAITLSYSSALPVISNASGVPFSVNPVRYWPGEDKIFAEMASGELDVDINGNGEFDIMDCYLLDSYDSEYYSYRENIAPEIIQRIESIADYDRNGVVDFKDTLSLMRYFIVSENIRAEYLDPAYYDPDIEPLTTEEQLINFGRYKEIQEYVFPMRMYYNVHYLDAEYYLVEDLYETGKVDLDFNGNGQLDIFDAYCIDVYFDEKKDSESVKPFLTEEEYERCWDFTFRYSEPLVPNHCGDFTRTATIAYILNHIELKPEYFTVAFYKENVNYSVDHCTAAAMKHAALNIGIEVSDNIGPTSDIEYSRKHFLDMDEFTLYYEKFCADIENGVRPVPDVNLDGVVDYYDYFDMNIYWGGNDAERSILPLKTWNTINKYYDIPDDDRPTLYEISSAQLYVIEHNEEIADLDSIYNAYVQSLIEAKENGQKDDFEPINNEDVQILDSDVKRSGDANEDGETNLADAVFIMQSLSNPDEYQLTENGKFNADVYNTGDGVTAMDALQIQLKTINLEIPVNT